MSRYRPALDDDRLVSRALRALADETASEEAPPAIEARLRAAFRGDTDAGAAPIEPRRSSAWQWVAVVGTAAGLAWLAYASLRAPVDAVQQVRSAPPAASPATPAPAAPTAAPRVAVAAKSAPRVVAPLDPPAVRVADTRPPRAARLPGSRPEPTVERFEPLYPGDLLADLDAVHLVRVSVPRSSLATLGWPSRPGQGGRDRVELDAMVGPDGVARAVRFISR